MNDMSQILDMAKDLPHINEYVHAAAISFVIDGETHIIEGNNHADCMHVAYEIHGMKYMKRDKNLDKSGFTLTPTGRFADRVESLEIAKRQGQLKDPNYDKTWLDSYAVNFKR